MITRRGIIFTAFAVAATALVARGCLNGLSKWAVEQSKKENATSPSKEKEK